MNELQGILSDLKEGDSSVRVPAENRLQELLDSSPEHIILLLCQLAMNDEIEESTKLMALVLAKRFIPRYWSVECSQFEGPLLSPDLKRNIRSGLINMINLPSLKNQLRDILIDIMIIIGQVDFPEEWPDLLSATFSMDFVPGVKLLDALLSDCFSASEFNENSKDILQYLSKLRDARNGDSLTDQESLECQAYVLSCLSSALQNVHGDETNLEPIPESHTWIQWVYSIITNVKFDVDNERITQSICFLKKNACVVLSSIVNIGNDKLTARYGIDDHLVRIILNDMKLIAQTPKIVSGTDIIEEMILAELELLRNTPNLKDYSQEILPVFQLIVSGRIDDFDPDDIDKYVSEELDGFAVTGDNVRWEIKDVEEFLISSDHIKYDPFLWSHLPQSDSRLLEAKLIMIIEDNVEYTEDQSENWTEEIFWTIKNSCIQFDNPQLQARAFQLIRNKCMKHKFLAETTSVLSRPDSEPIALLTALLALPPNSGVPPLLVFPLLARFMPGAEDETPAVLIEILGTFIEDNYSVAYESPDVINFLFSSGNNYSAGTSAAIELEDIMEKITFHASQNGKYVDICNYALPLLLQEINNNILVDDVSYSNGLLLALDLIAAVVKEGPDDYPQDIARALADPIYQCCMKSNDSAIMYSACEAFSYLIEKSPVVDVGLCLTLADRLLSEDSDESLSILVGRLLLSILNRYFSQLSTETVVNLVILSAKKLLRSEHVLVVRSMIDVILYFFSISAVSTLNILLQESLCQPVLNRWFKEFSILTDTTEVQKQIEMMKTLYLLHDPRIDSMEVDDEEMEDPRYAGVIMTRSKRKNLPAYFSKITVPRMIIKQFKERAGINGELANSASANDDDDEWEDEEPADGGGGFNSEEDSKIAASLKAWLSSGAVSQKDL